METGAEISPSMPWERSDTKTKLWNLWTKKVYNISQEVAFNYSGMEYEGDKLKFLESSLRHVRES